jgi:glucose-1-phosphate adenylyltransferase
MGKALPDLRTVSALILGGGRGTRLYPLTKIRAKPAVPLAAKYRLIDIPISNCIHSGINKIFVLTQFLSVSLHKHIRQTYVFDHFNGGFVELLAAQQTMDAGTNWYEGTADAVRKNLLHLDRKDLKYVLILSGDQLYRMDYRDMLRTHVESGAEVTIAAIPVHRGEAKSLGVLRCDDSGRVQGFLEKSMQRDETAWPAWGFTFSIGICFLMSWTRQITRTSGRRFFQRRSEVVMSRRTSLMVIGRILEPSARSTKPT